MRGKIKILQKTFTENSRNVFNYIKFIKRTFLSTDIFFSLRNKFTRFLYRLVSVQNDRKLSLGEGRSYTGTGT